jgi:uncharacterized protein with HEPN domain
MPKDDGLYLGHMLDMARKACAKTASIQRGEYDADENLRLALAHLIQVIGEAARRVSPEGRAAHPEIPWREVMGIRHKIVHDYMDLNDDVIWEVVTRDLPGLVQQLERFVPPMDD